MAPSNLTAAHFLAACSDRDCLDGLVAMLQDVVNGDLDPESVDIICATTSIASDKPNSGGKVRPIAMPEIIYKLAGHICMEAVMPHTKTFFPSIQLGVGIKGGV